MTGLVTLMRRVFTRSVAPFRTPGSRLLLFGLAAGVLGGLVAGVFDAVRALAGLLLLGTAEASLAPAGWRVFFGPVLGGVLAGGVMQLGGLTRPMGMGRLMEHIQLRGGKVPWVDGAFTAVAAALALGSGHSGGREAPVAGLSAALSRELGTRLRLPAVEVRVLVAAAAAAAIAASFNTPLGSALLALEVLLSGFALRYFAPVVAATVAGTLVGQAVLGDRVAFHVPGFSLGHPAELIGYALLGVVCGAMAAAIHIGVQWADRWSETNPMPAVLRGAAAGAFVGVLGAIGLSGVMGTGYPLIERVLAEPGAVGLPLLLALVVGKYLTTLSMVASRTGPGLFSPILVIGATTGALFGLAVEAWLPGTASAGSFGLVAMGALAAATLRAPLSMILVLFELTGDYAVVPTMMLTAAVAMLVSGGLCEGSVYDALLANRGVRLDREVPAELRALSIADLMQPGYTVVGPEPTLEQLAEAFRSTRDNLVWSVGQDGRYLGAIHVQDVLDAVTGVEDGGELLQAVPALVMGQTAADAITLLAGLEIDEVPVVDADGVLVGVLTERSLLGALHGSVPPPTREDSHADVS